MKQKISFEEAYGRVQAYIASLRDERLEQCKKLFADDKRHVVTVARSGCVCGEAHLLDEILMKFDELEWFFGVPSHNLAFTGEDVFDESFFKEA